MEKISAVIIDLSEIFREITSDKLEMILSELNGFRRLIELAWDFRKYGSLDTYCEYLISYNNCVLSKEVIMIMVKIAPIVCRSFGNMNITGYRIVEVTNWYSQSNGILGNVLTLRVVLSNEQS